MPNNIPSQNINRVARYTKIIQAKLYSINVIYNSVVKLWEYSMDEYVKSLNVPQSNISQNIISAEENKNIFSYEYYQRNNESCKLHSN